MQLQTVNFSETLGMTDLDRVKWLQTNSITCKLAHEHQVYDKWELIFTEDFVCQILG